MGFNLAFKGLTSLALLPSLKRLSFPEPTCAIHTNCDVIDVVRSQDVGLEVETDVNLCLYSPARFASSQVCVQYNPFIQFPVVHK